MKKNVPFLWTQEHTDAHNLLKALFQENLSLRLPNPNLPYVIHTDASCHAASAVQHQREGDELFPIAFHSQTLTETQLQHSILDKELFALVDSIKRYEFYVSGTSFQVYTDSRVLFYLREAKESNAKLYRYSLLLQGYDFTITHLKSSENLVADALSRVCSSNMEERAKEVNRAKKDILDEMRRKVKEMSVPDGTKFDGKIISTLLKQVTVPEDVLTSVIEHNFSKECRITDFQEGVHISQIESDQEEDDQGSRNIQKEILAATLLQAGNMDIEDFIKLQNEDQFCIATKNLIQTPTLGKRFKVKQGVLLRIPGEQVTEDETISQVPQIVVPQTLTDMLIDIYHAGPSEHT